jgi:oxygen-independent coproporphyrinogen III oxidase
MAWFGVYLHFPWCRKRCPYCDFAIETGPPPHRAYLDQILAELAARAPTFEGRALRSIYLGGGTPSLWEPGCLAAAVGAIATRFAASPVEITLEANPTDVTPGALDAWRAAGVTRVSIGVQSFDPAALVALGRDHRFGDGRAAIAAALAAGLDVSADFILGVPGAGDLAAQLLDDRPPHLSVYELTIEERTAFGQRVRDGRLVPIDDDRLAELYVAMHERLTAAGYEHYEISSYARPGHRAIHNAQYWTGEAFLGLGVGAASLELYPDGGGARLTNPRRAADYGAGARAEHTPLTAGELAQERAWLGLRTRDGIAEAALAPAPDVADWLVATGLAERIGDRICPTLRGFLFHDRIAARIVRDWVW